MHQTDGSYPFKLKNELWVVGNKEFIVCCEEMRSMRCGGCGGIGSEQCKDCTKDTWLRGGTAIRDSQRMQGMNGLDQVCGSYFLASGSNFPALSSSWAKLNTNMSHIKELECSRPQNHLWKTCGMGLGSRYYTASVCQVDQPPQLPRNRHMCGPIWKLSVWGTAFDQYNCNCFVVKLAIQHPERNCFRMKDAKSALFTLSWSNKG